MPSTATPTTTWLDALIASPAFGELAARVRAGASSSCRGSVGSSTTIVAAAVHRAAGAPLLLVHAHLDDADEALEELEAFGISAARLPAMEVVPGETSVNLELLAERLSLVRRIVEGSAPDVLVASIAALMQAVPAPQRLDQVHRTIRRGARVESNELLHWLDAAGYRRVQTLEDPGDFAVRGGIIDLYPPGSPPARIDLFGDEVEALYEVDLDTMGSDRRIDRLDLVAMSPDIVQHEKHSKLLPELLVNGTAAVLADVAEIEEQGRSYHDRVSDARGISPSASVLKALSRRGPIIEVGRIGGGSAAGAAIDLPVTALPAFDENAGAAFGELAELASSHEVIVLCQNDGEAQRTGELLEEFAGSAPVAVHVHYLHRGFIWERPAAAPLALIPHHELLHRYQTRRRIRRVAGTRTVDAFLDLQPGDYVVHRDHGIARFAGLRAMEGVGGDGADEYLTLEFAGSGRLHVPATKIELVQKYVGAFKGQPELSTLGGRKWKNQKQRVEEAVRDLAAEMLRLQAAREALPGVAYPADTLWQREFEAEFPYEETEDQLTAIAAVKRDMSDRRPMDRLICGDVGFGKTEVAIRAAFKAAEYGRQVAVLVPTTWLAEQHGRTFRERFSGYPFRIESLSRFRTGMEIKAILDELRRGRVDIVIGTHRLLSPDVRFADLGLVIIDEEQRFGVEHKQRLLAFRATADVLTMTATPIPRTLHMAMLGLRDISSLSTAPLDRRAIVTEIIADDERRVRHAIARELAREGQIFFVHNRVHDIMEVADRVKIAAPDARVIVGHGQMPSRQLEKVMRTFVRGEADILVCTTIIESGVDIPTANTMFIHDAHMYGLSELHQLRGRVGRHKHRAYCYLMLDPGKTITPEAMKRLRALESFSMLGAGFKIALRDLEIRGAGNLLGPEQSGHIAAVGYEMYCQLLEQSVAELRHEPRRTTSETTIDLGITGTLPRGWIPSDARRLDAYRRLGQAATMDELEHVRHDLVSAYGELPRPAQRLLDLAAIRIGAAAIGARSIVRHDDDIIFRVPDPSLLEQRMSGAKGSLRRVGTRDTAGLHEVYYRPPKSYLEGRTLLTVLRRRLNEEAGETMGNGQ